MSMVDFRARPEPNQAQVISQMQAVIMDLQARVQRLEYEIETERRLRLAMKR